MEAWNNESLYRSPIIWEQYIKNDPTDRFYMNPERTLNERLNNLLKDPLFPNNPVAIEAIRHKYAKEVYDYCLNHTVKEQLDILKELDERYKHINHRKARVGHEISHDAFAFWQKAHYRFEFNCILLKDFKAKYNL